jgi:hypothetical protein
MARSDSSGDLGGKFSTVGSGSAAVETAKRHNTTSQHETLTGLHIDQTSTEVLRRNLWARCAHRSKSEARNPKLKARMFKT